MSSVVSAVTFLCLFFAMAMGVGLGLLLKFYGTTRSNSRHSEGEDKRTLRLVEVSAAESRRELAELRATVLELKNILGEMGLSESLKKLALLDIIWNKLGLLESTSLRLVNMEHKLELLEIHTKPIPELPTRADIDALEEQARVLDLSIATLPASFEERVRTWRDVERLERIEKGLIRLDFLSELPSITTRLGLLESVATKDEVTHVATLVRDTHAQEVRLLSLSDEQSLVRTQVFTTQLETMHARREARGEAEQKLLHEAIRKLASGDDVEAITSILADLLTALSKTARSEELPSMQSALVRAIESSQSEFAASIASTARSTEVRETFESLARLHKDLASVAQRAVSEESVAALQMHVLAVSPKLLELQKRIELSTTPKDLEPLHTRIQLSTTPKDLEPLQRRIELSTVPKDLEPLQARIQLSTVPKDLEPLQARIQLSTVLKDLEPLQKRIQLSTVPKDLEPLQKRIQLSTVPKDLEPLQKRIQLSTVLKDLEPLQKRIELSTVPKDLEPLQKRIELSTVPKDLEPLQKRIELSTVPKDLEPLQARIQLSTVLKDLEPLQKRIELSTVPKDLEPLQKRIELSATHKDLEPLQKRIELSTVHKDVEPLQAAIQSVLVSSKAVEIAAAGLATRAALDTALRELRELRDLPSLVSALPPLFDALSQSQTDHASSLHQALDRTKLEASHSLGELLSEVTRTSKDLGKSQQSVLEGLARLPKSIDTNQLEAHLSRSFEQTQVHTTQTAAGLERTLTSHLQETARRSEGLAQESSLAAVRDDVLLSDAQVRAHIDEVRVTLESVENAVRELPRPKQENARTSSEPEQQAEVALVTQAPEEEARPRVRKVKPKAAPAPAPLPLPADDLKAIVGIGPALEKVLKRRGIRRFTDLANLTREQIEALDESLPKFRGRIKREKWVSQAKRLSRNT
jgi:predicted flap endonuclease-1-like 5' DNA nuclease